MPKVAGTPDWTPVEAQAMAWAYQELTAKDTDHKGLEDTFFNAYKTVLDIIMGKVTGREAEAWNDDEAKALFEARPHLLASRTPSSTYSKWKNDCHLSREQEAARSNCADRHS